MANSQFRGLSDEQIIHEQLRYRDVRPFSVKAWDALTSRIGVVCALWLYAAIGCVVPAFAAVMLVAGTLHYLVGWLSHRREALPLRLPEEAARRDYGDRAPSTKPNRPRHREFHRASGRVFLGWCAQTGFELWTTFRDLVRHWMVFGTTGAGKTERLISIVANALAYAGGFAYNDPKGGPKVWAQIYALARMVGREHSCRLQNYTTKEKPPAGTRLPLFLSNTTNPFAFGPAELLFQTLISQMPASDDASGNAIFAKNAESLAAGLMYPLVERRDKGVIELSISTIRSYMNFEKCIELSQARDVSEVARGALSSFLTAIGYSPGVPLDKQLKARDQFGYARAYFQRALASLVDTYGHIYDTSFGELDPHDIIKQRRIMAVVIPNLAMAPSEVANVGKLNLSCLRNAAAAGLSGKVQGTIEELLEDQPSYSPDPFMMLTDEYAAIPTPGYADINTQGRGLNVASVTASQDFPGIKRADEAGAHQLMENSAVKEFYKTLTGGETYQQLEGMLGEAGMAMVDELEAGAIGYREQLQAKRSNVKRAHLRDLQEQVEGEGHLVMDGKLLRTKAFYANPPIKKVGQGRVNQMVEVFTPERRELERRFGRLKDLAEEMARRIRERKFPAIGQPQEALKDVLKVYRDPLSDPMSTAIAALMHFDASKDSRFERLGRERARSVDVRKSHERSERGGVDPFAEDDFFGDAGTPRGSGGAEAAHEGEDPWIRALAKGTRWAREVILDEQLESDLIAIEASAGEADVDLATRSARAIVDRIKEDLDYPPGETPVPTPSNEADLDDAVTSFVDRLKKRKRTRE